MALAVDLDVEPRRQRVDDRDADAVQAAGHLVAAAAELAAGVQHGEHDLDRRTCPRSRRSSTGMPRPLSLTRTPPSASSVDLDAVAVAGQRLVDRVVHDLVDQVVQAALAGRADVHARPLAHRLEALEHLDVAGVVVAGQRRGRCGRRDDRDGGRERWERIQWARTAAAGWVTGHLSSGRAGAVSTGRPSRGALVGRGRHLACVRPSSYLSAAARNGRQGRLGTAVARRTRVGMDPPTRTGLRDGLRSRILSRRCRAGRGPGRCAGPASRTAPTARAR